MTGGILVTVPIRTVSESNVRGHWAKKAGRVSGHREAAGLAVRAALHKLVPVPIPALVVLTRVAPRVLDDDNLRAALKACRDGVADAFGVDDRDPRVTYAYDQRRGAAGVYAVEIAIGPPRVASVSKTPLAGV